MRHNAGNPGIRHGTPSHFRSRNRPAELVPKNVSLAGWYLMKDALGQALILMLIGTGVGLGLAVGIGKLFMEGGEFPFTYRVGMVTSSMVLLIVCGLIGAAFAIRKINAVDAMIALGREQ